MAAKSLNEQSSFLHLEREDLVQQLLLLAFAADVLDDRNKSTESKRRELECLSQAVERLRIILHLGKVHLFSAESCSLPERRQLELIWEFADCLWVHLRDGRLRRDQDGAPVMGLWSGDRGPLPKDRSLDVYALTGYQKKQVHWWMRCFGPDREAAANPAASSPPSSGETIGPPISTGADPGEADEQPKEPETSIPQIDNASEDLDSDEVVAKRSGGGMETHANRRSQTPKAQEQPQPKRPANLNHWGIGCDGKSRWQLFQKKSEESPWRLRGTVEIPFGLQNDVLMVFCRNGGSARKNDLLETLRRPGKTDAETMESQGSPTLSKLRMLIKEAIKRAARLDEVDNPLPPPEQGGDTWIAAITIGYATLSDTVPRGKGDKLTMSKKLTLLTAEQRHVWDRMPDPT